MNIRDIQIEDITLQDMARDYEELGRDYIQICWHVSDVQEIRPDLTPEQSYEVLLRVLSNHNSDVGITWDVIEECALTLFPEEI